MRRLGFILALSGLGFGCGHPQDEGAYRLTLGTVVRDECGLAARDDLVKAFTLTIAGERLYADYSLFDLQLVGAFRDSPLFEPSEQFTMDGSAANVTSPVNGQDCLLDLVTAHLEATTGRNPVTFAGALRVKLDTRRPEACVCEFMANIDAQRSGP